MQPKRPLRGHISSNARDSYTVISTTYCRSIFNQLEEECSSTQFVQPRTLVRMPDRPTNYITKPITIANMNICKFTLQTPNCLFLIGNYYLWSHLLRAQSLAEKQPITGRYWQICCIVMCTRFSNLRFHSPFSTKESSTQIESDCLASDTMGHKRSWATQNSPLRSLGIYTDRPRKPHWTKEQLPGRNVKTNSAENYHFFATFFLFFFLYFISFL